MKTIIIVCHEERGIRVGDELKPTKDAILHVTSTTICGSDLYLYHDKVEGIWSRGRPWDKVTRHA